MSKSGLHNKPAGCRAAEAYASGNGSEERRRKRTHAVDTKPSVFTIITYQNV
jgi:hypothetical protein